MLDIPLRQIQEQYAKLADASLKGTTLHYDLRKTKRERLQWLGHNHGNSEMSASPIYQCTHEPFKDKQNQVWRSWWSFLVTQQLRRGVRKNTSSFHNPRLCFFLHTQRWNPDADHRNICLLVTEPLIPQEPSTGHPDIVDASSRNWVHWLSFGWQVRNLNVVEYLTM